ncbi:ATP-binding protein [Novosphingobium sp. M1R2S20]|uniref:ATP-binding protein n=1 Tax=Novosphingobium rhizovicinum TaxID=3228928 RepID=A0ABV3R9L6_9SPHN
MDCQEKEQPTQSLAAGADIVETLSRIANALDRLAPCKAANVDWWAFPGYIWDGSQTRGVARLDAPSLDLLRGIESQKERVVTNVRRHAAGHAAHDMLLWGSRGMGKSALLRAAVLEAQGADLSQIALVQVSQAALPEIGRLFNELSRYDRRFFVFIDDLGFEEADTAGPRLLRSWLEGGVEARPSNVRLAVTSNRRAIVGRSMVEQDDPINPRDAADDKLALADRFGLSIGFHNCSQDDYLEIVSGYASALHLRWRAEDALEWSQRRGARSGRVAWQYIAELAGRAGKSL